MISLSQETEALALRMARARRLPVEEIVRAALEEKARAEGIDVLGKGWKSGTSDEIAARRARTDAFVADLAALPILDERSPRDIMDDINCV